MRNSNRRKPGQAWRILAWDKWIKDRGWTEKHEMADQGVFDELVLDDWLHLEQMDSRAWWMRIGDMRVWVTVPLKGPVVVTVDRGEYGPVVGETRVPKSEISSRKE